LGTTTDKKYRMKKNDDKNVATLDKCGKIIKIHI
jgi:hypothetical protein